MSIQYIDCTVGPHWNFRMGNDAIQKCQMHTYIHIHFRRVYYIQHSAAAAESKSSIFFDRIRTHIIHFRTKANTKNHTRYGLVRANGKILPLYFHSRPANRPLSLLCNIMAHQNVQKYYWKDRHTKNIIATVLDAVCFLYLSLSSRFSCYCLRIEKEIFNFTKNLTLWIASTRKSLILFSHDGKALSTFGWYQVEHALWIFHEK